MTDTYIYYTISTDTNGRGRWRYIIRENGQREIYASKWRYETEKTAFNAGDKTRKMFEAIDRGEQ